VEDTRPISERPNLTDESQVERYEMEPETYAARSDSVLAWKKAQHLGRFDPQRDAKMQDSHHSLETQTFKHIESRGIQIGSRCSVGEADRRGVVRFIGVVQSLPAGTWVGVEYDEPVGKNDGSYAGVRYFQTQTKRGGFLRPDKIQVGEFPEKDLMDDDDEEI